MIKKKRIKGGKGHTKPPPVRKTERYKEAKCPESSGSRDLSKPGQSVNLRGEEEMRRKSTRYTYPRQYVEGFQATGWPRPCDRAD